MKLQLVTLSGTKMDEDVHEVIVPTASGVIGVLPGHEPLVTLAVNGIVKVRRHSGTSDMEIFAINGGIVEVSNNAILILVDEAESSVEIFAAEAEAALERAKKRLLTAKDPTSINEAQALIDRHAVRLKVANLRRRHHR